MPSATVGVIGGSGLLQADSTGVPPPRDTKAGGGTASPGRGGHMTAVPHAAATRARAGRCTQHPVRGI